MSALDRLSNFSMKDVNAKSDVFDINTPSGAFFNRVHSMGYKMYETVYKKDSEVLSESDYNKLSDEEKEGYVSDIAYTELYKAISTADNQKINAVAGSGKTTMLVFKIIHDYVTGETMTRRTIPNGNSVVVANKVWVCTFLNSGAEELQKALRFQQRKLGYSDTVSQFNFSTLDAEFKRCLNAMGASTPIGDDKTLNSLFRKAVQSCNITRGGSPLTNEDYQIISGIVTYYRGRLDKERYNHPSCRDYDLTPSILDLLVKQYASLRQAKGVVDFDEIQELLYKYLYVTPNPNVQEFVANRYNFIYIDEFQDTSQMQYAILKFYARGKLWMNVGGTEEDSPLYTGADTLGKIVAIGDNSQCIYSFKGSDSSILVSDFEKDFRPTLSYLSKNWRCPANILNPVVSSIHKNSDSASQVIVANREGGDFKALCFNSYKAMCEQLKQDMKDDVKNNMNVGILCRTNYDGMIPAFILEASGGFDFSISGDNMTLSSPLSRKLLGVARLFTDKSSTAVKDALSNFVERYNVWQLPKLIDVMKMNSMSIWQIPEEDLHDFSPSLNTFIKGVKSHFIVDGVRKKDLEVSALRYIYCYMISNTFSGDSAYCEGARAYLETLIYVIDNGNFESVIDFLEEIDFVNDKLKGRVKKDNVPIKIATVHEYKGKESDSIYIWNDSQGVFPSSKCDENNETQLNEERRVHYIACTRAKKKERIYTLANKVGMFVQEMDCELEFPDVIKMSLNKGTESSENEES